MTQPSTMAHDLDVRPLAPKHRADAILGAYASLALGATLRLIVDHDPECMYYTLLATEPKGSFAFEYLERGPVVWRVEVTKRSDALRVADASRFPDGCHGRYTPSGRR